MKTEERARQFMATKLRRNNGQLTGYIREMVVEFAESETAGLRALVGELADNIKWFQEAHGMMVAPPDTLRRAEETRKP